MMHNYTSVDVNSCFESKRIVFVGDSITRQLFFSVAHLSDPNLPSAPPTSFEKHSDHSFLSGMGTEFAFYWDPWLNSTETSSLLKGGGFGGRDTPGLLVIGSGLWFLRYAESSGGISAWEGTMEKTLDMISKSMPGLAEEIVILPGEILSSPFTLRSY
jgi:N-acetylneuraminate 9-O-acetyltransferase